ncbi:MAG TPA: hypothetical protein VKD91_08425 [Pyrinomonadaceae bacterium]|nr:hypothetical protein [Pyrinomonadaceae bacterium]
MKTFDFADAGGLFDHFEVNREPFWPRVAWLVAGSGAWHLVLIACIVLIPPVRDAFAITAMFSGAGFVDRPYTHTEIGDDAEIIDFTTEKFHYPEGYFLMDQQGLFPPAVQYPVIPPFKPVSMSAASSTPTPTPGPSPTPSATPGLEIAGNSAPGKTAEVKPSPSPNADDKTAEQAQKQLEEASKKTGIEIPKEGEINKAPFKDLAVHATELRDKKLLDFDKPFEVTIDTSLDKDGKLINPTVTRKSGDDTLIDLGKRLVAAMNDSGVLFYLKKINEDKPGTKVTFTIKQEANEVVAIVESETSSADSANKLSRGFALMLLVGADSRKGHDEEVLLKSTKVSADGDKVVFKLTLPRDEAVDIVKKGMAIPSPTVTPG